MGQLLNHDPVCVYSDARQQLTDRLKHRRSLPSRFPARNLQGWWQHDSEA
jgi:hypothetical protein